MISAGDFRNGVTLEIDGQVVQVIEFQHVKPGKGAAFVRTKLKNVINGGVVERTFRPTEKFPQARIDRVDMQYLYADGDLYEDPAYITCFRTVLQAIRERRKLRISFRGKNGTHHSFVCVPHRLEYSAKDDKFRLLASGKHAVNWINLGRVSSCTLLEAYPPAAFSPPQTHTEELVLMLHDERNGLERVLLHFSHFEKETRRKSEGEYEIRIRYDRDDETELLIRVLSFGPVLEVKAPDRFIQLVRERIQNQLGYTPLGV